MEKTDEEKKREKQEQWYNHLIHARDFHYEQFMQWSSYFYVIIGALLHDIGIKECHAPAIP